MVETIEEFAEEIRAIRGEVAAHGEKADVSLLASWLDRLLLSLEKVSPTISLMAVELEALSNTEPLEFSEYVPAEGKAAKKQKITKKRRQTIKQGKAKKKKRKK